MPSIIYDFPTINKALLGDSWWEPKPKPKLEPLPPKVNFLQAIILLESIKESIKDNLLYRYPYIYPVEHTDVLQDPRANPGGAVRTGRPLSRWKRASLSRSSPTTPPNETDELISP